MSTIQYITADVLRTMPADFAGCTSLIVDSPYSPHVHENAVSANRDGRGYVERDLGFEALNRQLRNHICKIAAHMSRWSVIFCDHEGAHWWRQDMYNKADYCREQRCITPDYEGDVPWIRWSQPQKSGDRPTQGSESVLHFHAPGRKAWNGPGSTTHYEAKALRGADKHPTEKPLDLMLDMVSWYSDPGDTVLDVCAGVGTTAIAAKLLGRDCVALEIDPKWKAVADRRLALEWSDRDVERVTRWLEATRTEATDFLVRNKPSDENVKARARAERRLRDVGIVLENVK